MVKFNDDALARPAEAAFDGDIVLLGTGSCFERGTKAIELAQQLMPPATPGSRAPALALHGDTVAIGIRKEGGHGAVHMFIAAPTRSSATAPK
jgi:hypothetical protein